MDPASNMEMSTDSGLGPPKAEHFFEGVEKLLEVWFETTDSADQQKKEHDLREILPESTWSEIIFPKVGCYIMSSKSDPHQTSYVLSESSLFLTKNKYILKTCGTTKCLSSLELVKNIVEEKSDGRFKISQVFYSRKNFINFEKQDGFYANDNFEGEYTYLDGILGGFCETKSYCLGKLSGSKWFVYQAISNEFSKPTAITMVPDQTLEILMLNLDPKIMSENFFGRKPQPKYYSNLKNLVKNTKFYDDQIFDPCGYSSNGLIDSNVQIQGYTTLHVTPEKDFSYVSFETNAEDDVEGIIERVIDCFKPKEFTVTLVASKNSAGFEMMMKKWILDQERDDTNCQKPDLADKQYCDFGNYGVIYKHFC